MQRCWGRRRCFHCLDVEQRSRTHLTIQANSVIKIACSWSQSLQLTLLQQEHWKTVSLQQHEFKKGVYCSSSELCFSATVRHLPYGITVLPATRHKWLCPLPPPPSLTPASKLVLDLSNPALTQATRQCTSQVSNLRSLDHKSSGLLYSSETMSCKL